MRRHARIEVVALVVIVFVPSEEACAGGVDEGVAAVGLEGFDVVDVLSQLRVAGG